MNSGDVFSKFLQKDEKLLWSGQPTGKIFTTADYFLVPFSLLWGSFAIFWEVSVIRQGAPLGMTLYGIPFVLIGLYFIAGRFIYKRYMKKHTYYALTNERALVAKSTRGNISLEACILRNVSSINKSTSKNGIGTIRFGNSSTIGNIYGNTGMDSFAFQYGSDALTFFDIADANTVYDLVSRTLQYR